MISWIGWHKLADIIFGTAKETPYIVSSNLIKFIIWRVTGH